MESEEHLDIGEGRARCAMAIRDASVRASYSPGIETGSPPTPPRVWTRKRTRTGIVLLRFVSLADMKQGR